MVMLDPHISPYQSILITQTNKIFLRCSPPPSNPDHPLPGSRKPPNYTQTRDWIQDPCFKGFFQGPGCLQGHTVRLHLKPEATPYLDPPRHPPFYFQSLQEKAFRKPTCAFLFIVPTMAMALPASVPVEDDCRRDNVGPRNMTGSVSTTQQVADKKVCEGKCDYQWEGCRAYWFDGTTKTCYHFTQLANIKGSYVKRGVPGAFGSQWSGYCI
eukprot:maker-scaffold815_size93432-snap-gene-0.16 protein:Tk07748 transcript:maker-scaffold815_size93432-snap-gene-0.16-mRNA-1 annotation:"hypothetical protein A1Q2_08170"